MFPITQFGVHYHLAHLHSMLLQLHFASHAMYQHKIHAAGVEAEWESVVAR